MKFNWVTLHVSDLEKSLAFYNGLLGLPVDAQFGGAEHQIVMLGDAVQPKVELICESGGKIEAPGNGISFGLQPENLDVLVEKLKAEGYAVSGLITPNPHVRFCFTKDPDGYTVQLVEQK